MPPMDDTGHDDLIEITKNFVHRKRGVGRSVRQLIRYRVRLVFRHNAARFYVRAVVRDPIGDLVERGAKLGVGKIAHFWNWRLLFKGVPVWMMFLTSHPRARRHATRDPCLWRPAYRRTGSRR